MSKSMTNEQWKKHNEPAAKRARYNKDGKRKYSIFPCDQCITLAVCKQKEQLECPLLYDYIRAGIYYQGIKCKKKKYRLKRISDCFKRTIGETYFSNTYKLHPDLLVTFLMTI